MKDFKKLHIWQLGMDLADRVHEIIEDVPWQTGRKLIDQLGSSSLSIPSNIAEGNARRSEKDKYRFIEIALGSAFELETRILFAERRKWSDPVKITEALELVRLEQQKLQAFMGALKP